MLTMVTYVKFLHKNPVGEGAASGTIRYVEWLARPKARTCESSGPTPNP